MPSDATGRRLFAVGYLVWDSPRGRVVHALDRSLTLVGRDAGNDLRIDDRTVSPRHALVERAGDRIRITDLHSETGTRINGAVLTPDLPSTLEPGDFVNLGRVVLTFHRAPPPPAAARGRSPTASARPTEVPPRRRWESPLLLAAFLLVVVAGALVATLLSRPQAGAPAVADSTPPPAEPVASERAEPEPRADPLPEPVPDPAPEPPSAPLRAPEGSRPPAEHAALDECPELLELDGERYCPVRLVDWDAQGVLAVGADGRLYRIPRAAVTKIEDRADLARRAERLRLALRPGDADGRLALAAWCAQRHVRQAARQLAREVLALRPNDPLARQLATAAGED